MRSLPLLLALPALAVAASWSCSGKGNGNLDAAGDVQADVMSPDTRQPADEPFGRACDNPGSACKWSDPEGYPLLCIAVAGSTLGKGFCTRTCSQVGQECYGVPNGQWAGCFIEAQAIIDAGTPATKYCGFLCKTSTNNWDCPATLSCGEANDKGQAICLP